MDTFVRTARGLTLIEMLGAMVVSAVILGSAWQLLHSGMRSYHHGLQEVRMTQAARTSLHIVTQDVQRALSSGVPHGITGLAPQPAPVVPEGARSERLALRLFPAVSGAHLGAEQSGQPQYIRYVLSPIADRTTLALRRVVASGDATHNERSLLVHEHLHALQARYFDGQTWSDTWQHAAVPRAVEITLVVQSGGARPRMSRFATLVTAE